MDLPIAKALVERAVGVDGYDIHILSCRTPQWFETVLPLPPATIQRTMVGDYCERKPALTLAHDSAQALLDGLWAAGLRPSSGQGAADVGVVSAMKAHIEDLRRVAGLTPKAPDAPTHPDAGTF